MKYYAKVDSNGNVVEFPYRQLVRLMPGATIPEDAVEVDTETQKPTDLKWYEAVWYNEIARTGDTYVASYTRGEKKWASVEEKKKTLSNLIEMAKQRIKLLQDANKKATALAVLDTINVEDEQTYDNYHNLGV